MKNVQKELGNYEDFFNEVFYEVGIFIFSLFILQGQLC